MGYSVIKELFPISVSTPVQNVTLIRFGKIRILHLNAKSGSAEVMTLETKDRPSDDLFFPMIGTAGNTYAKLGRLSVHANGLIYKTAWQYYNTNGSGFGLTENGSALAVWVVN